MAENKNTTENNKNSTIPENNEQLLERIMEKTQDEFLDESEESSENTEDIKDTEETEGKEEQGEQAESTEDTENEPEEMKEKSAKKKKKSIYNRILSYLSGFTGSIKAVAIAPIKDTIDAISNDTSGLAKIKNKLSPKQTTNANAIPIKIPEHI